MLKEANIMTQTAAQNHKETKTPSGQTKTGWENISFVEPVMTHGAFGIAGGRGNPNLTVNLPLPLPHHRNPPAESV